VAHIDRISHEYSTHTFVDGGYIDNSGTETLTAALRALESHIRSKQNVSVRFYVIRIHFSEREQSSEETLQTRYDKSSIFDRPPPGVAASDLATPISALNSVAEARSDAALSLLKQLLASDTRLFYPEILEFRFTRIWQLEPLGWSMSKRAIDDLMRQAPQPTFKPQTIEFKIPTAESSSYLLDFWIKLLTGMDADKAFEKLHEEWSKERENPNGTIKHEDSGQRVYDEEIAEDLGLFLCLLEPTGQVLDHKRAAVTKP
jgi:hypothetical protein